MSSEFVRPLFPFVLGCFCAYSANFRTRRGPASFCLLPAWTTLREARLGRRPWIPTGIPNTGEDQRNIFENRSHPVMFACRSVHCRLSGCVRVCVPQVGPSRRHVYDKGFFIGKRPQTSRRAVRQVRNNINYFAYTNDPRIIEILDSWSMSMYKNRIKSRLAF